MPDRVRLERLLGGPELADLRRRLRLRFERDSRSEAFTLTSLSSVERTALEGLLGRGARRAASMRLSVAELDRALVRAGLAAGLRAALENLDGPIRDVAREHRDREQRWDEVFTDVDSVPLHALLEDAAARGLVKRLVSGDPARGRAHLRQAAEVLACLPAQGVPRSRLAAELLHDAHGLDDGRPVATLVLAALGRLDPVPGLGASSRREQWARQGVLVNELAAPVLVLGLVASSRSPAGAIAAAARDAGEAVHLSLRALLREPADWEVRSGPVFVCENPSVVASAADWLGTGCAPLVCVEGMPGAAPQALLRQLAESGARLRYHGDFDWAGVRIGNFVMRRFGAVSWRFGAVDYEPEHGRSLGGPEVDADWDPALTPKMMTRGVALEEEAVLELLLDDLCGGPGIE